MRDGTTGLQRPNYEAARAKPPVEISTPTPGGDTLPETVNGVPVKRWSQTFDTFDLSRNPDMGKAVEQCRKVAAGESWCALLGGTPGTGKTHLAIATMHDWFDRWPNPSGRFWKVPELLDWLRKVAYDDGLDLGQIIRSYTSPGFLLVLDDLGTENGTDWANEQMYRILDGRYDNESPTVITTNQALDRIDLRIRSRYREGLVICQGQDVRAMAKSR